MLGLQEICAIGEVTDYVGARESSHLEELSIVFEVSASDKLLALFVVLCHN